MASLCKKLGRKCSHCGNIGHNSRTCLTHKNAGRMKLFGVQLLDPSSSYSNSNNFSIKKSFSVDCLSVSPFNIPAGSRALSCSTPDEQSAKLSSGYLSDGLIRRSQEKKKGMPWTAEEHRIFLVGLEKLGKGDWRGISRHFVTTKTPTQVASHAQKYFLRQKSLNKMINRRPSLFDMVERDKSALDSVRETLDQECSISKGVLLSKTNDSSMMNFGSSSQQDSKSSTYYVSVPVGLCESLESSLIRSGSSRTSTPVYSNDQSSSSPPPNLELTLGVPQAPLNQSKTSVASCLLTVV